MQLGPLQYSGTPPAFGVAGKLLWRSCLFVVWLHQSHYVSMQRVVGGAWQGQCQSAWPVAGG